jgi:hypothetical protein
MLRSNLIGSAHELNYGVFSALESDYSADLGRAFYAQRLAYPTGAYTFGYVGTFVDRPFLDRRASVNGFDLSWRRDEHLAIDGQIVQTDVRQSGQSLKDGMQWLRLDLTPSAAGHHQLELAHFGKDLDFNDLGYLPRPNLNRLYAVNSFTDSSFPEGAPLQSLEWLLQTKINYNDHGQRLPSELALNASLTLRNGNGLSFYLIARPGGTDDLISRGHGDVQRPARRRGQIVWNTPRRGDWSFFGTVAVDGEGLGKPVFSGALNSTWFASDSFTTSLAIGGRTSNDWLLWRQDDVLARFDHEALSSSIDLNWLPAAAHELRAKLQWVVVDARHPRALRIGVGGELLPSSAEVKAFSVTNFGLQLRYRWTFAPQSDFYAVYSRGGFDFDDSDERTTGLPSLISDATYLRDSDQFVAKVCYRF